MPPLAHLLLLAAAASASAKTAPASPGSGPALPEPSGDPFTERFADGLKGVAEQWVIPEDTLERGAAVVSSGRVTLWGTNAYIRTQRAFTGTYTVSTTLYRDSMDDDFFISLCYLPTALPPVTSSDAFTHGCASFIMVDDVLGSGQSEVYKAIVGQEKNSDVQVCATAGAGAYHVSVTVDSLLHTLTFVDSLCGTALVLQDDDLGKWPAYLYLGVDDDYEEGTAFGEVTVTVGSTVVDEPLVPAPKPEQSDFLARMTWDRPRSRLFETFPPETYQGTTLYDGSKWSIPPDIANDHLWFFNGAMLMTGQGVSVRSAEAFKAPFVVNVGVVHDSFDDDFCVLLSKKDDHHHFTYTPQEGVVKMCLVDTCKAGECMWQKLAVGQESANDAFYDPSLQCAIPAGRTEYLMTVEVHSDRVTFLDDAGCAAVSWHDNLAASGPLYVYIGTDDTDGTWSAVSVVSVVDSRPKSSKPSTEFTAAALAAAVVLPSLAIAGILYGVYKREALADRWEQLRAYVAERRGGQRGANLFGTRAGGTTPYAGMDDGAGVESDTPGSQYRPPASGEAV